MSKFGSKPVRPNVKAPVATTAVRARTHEGHLGFVRDAKSELFLLAVSNMVGDDTFYEGKTDRDERFRLLVHACVTDDPAWVAGFVPYLRDTMQMRSASVVMAAEYVAAGGPNGRAVVASALARADEPAEILAYWAQQHGRNFPQPLKRGVADAVKRLYNERAALKYDGKSRAWRMGDVIEITHPKPTAEWQSELYRWLLDARRDRAARPEGLPMLSARYDLEAVPVAERRAALNGGRLAEAGMTWEALSGWLQGPMDAQAWEAVIPSMGYMALLRNLRNFEEATVSDTVLRSVADTLSDPEKVRASRQFPLRFLSAYKALASERFAWPVEQAVELSVENIPHFPGRTLILIDVSGSMQDRLSARSELQRWEAAALFGMALAKRCDQPETIAYNTTGYRVNTQGPLLRLVSEFRRLVGGGTYTMQTLSHTYAGHDRVVILTDEQAHPGQLVQVASPIYTFNLGGYRVAQMASGQHGSYTFGGLTDAGFRLLGLLDAQRSTGWPWVAA